MGIGDTAEINSAHCLKDNNKSMESFSFYEKSQHCDRSVFPEEMFSR